MKPGALLGAGVALVAAVDGQLLVGIGAVLAPLVSLILGLLALRKSRAADLSQQELLLKILMDRELGRVSGDEHPAGGRRADDLPPPRRGRNRARRMGADPRGDTGPGDRDEPGTPV